MVSLSALPGPSGSGRVKCSPSYATRLAPQRHPDDVDVLAGAPERLGEPAPRASPRSPAGPETPRPSRKRPAGQRVEGGRGHRGHRRRAGRDLHDGRAQVDPLGLARRPTTAPSARRSRRPPRPTPRHTRGGRPPARRPRCPRRCPCRSSRGSRRVPCEQRPGGELSAAASGPSPRPLPYGAMRHRRMGTSGLSVSRLALGTMTWGRTHRRGGRARAAAHVPGRRRHPRRHGPRLRRRRRRGVPRRGSSTTRSHREDVVVCTKAGISRRSGPARGRHLAAQPAEPARHLARAPRHRPRRPVAGPHLERRGAADRDPVGAGVGGQHRPGALRRRLELQRLADRPGR